MSQFGWISMHRKIQEHWVWSDASYFKAWAAILLNVNHTPKKALIKGKLLECERGQSLNSLSTWGKIFGNWSTKKVRTFLKNLEIDKMVVVESVGITTRLTVCNYDEYQTGGHAEETQKKRAGHARGTRGARTGYTNNNGNNEKNDKNEKKITPKGFLVANSIDWIKQEVWDEWIEHKKKVKASVSLRALKANITELEKFGAENANSIICQSLDSGWKGLFNLRQGNVSNNKTMEQHGEEWLALAED